MKLLWIPLLAMWFLPSITSAQDSLSYQDQYRQEYLQRIQKSHINGFYIPVDLPDALRVLDEIVDEQGKQKFASRPDSIAVSQVFFSFGRWININWGMEFGSRLTVALNELGVSYPDDMTRLIMYAYHRHLNQKEIRIENLVQRVIEEREVRERQSANLARDEP
ncbi:MAG TPA: DUF6794 domain-containing protein [Membranihabitans sp.]|nr:DUF6794 domain-containing protein [Membranihabitans sp.]